MAALTRRAWLRSLKTRALLLTVLFAAMPAALYLVFQDADRERQSHLIDSIRAQSLTAGHALTEIIAHGDTSPLYRLNDELARYATDGRSLRLLLKPAEDPSAGFSLIAAAPKVETSDVDQARQRLQDLGVLDRLGASCAGDQPTAERINRDDGSAEMVTAVVPVNTSRGCWALVVANALTDEDVRDLGESYWRRPEIRIAGAIYFAFAALVLLICYDLMRSLSGFAAAAKEIAAGRSETHFFIANAVPELKPVAKAIDDMVGRLREGASHLRDAADEMVHAFKTPIGTIRQAAETLRRRVPPEDPRGRVALEAIDNALDRLDSLVGRARRLDENAAHLLQPSSLPIRLSDLIAAVLDGMEPDATTRGIALAAAPQAKATISHGANLIAAALEQLIDNALVFSPPGSTVTIGADISAQNLKLTVRDQGPGVDPDKLDHLFTRGITQRPEGAPMGLGLGLWIVKRNVGLLRGTVIADNAPGGGFAVTIEIPSDHYQS